MKKERPKYNKEFDEKYDKVMNKREKKMSDFKCFKIEIEHRRDELVIHIKLKPQYEGGPLVESFQVPYKELETRNPYNISVILYEDDTKENLIIKVENVYNGKIKELKANYNNMLTPSD